MGDNESAASTLPGYEYGLSSVTSVSPCDSTDLNNFGRKFLPPFYAIIFTISLLGNGLVLFIMYKFERLNTVTNIFLINLVTSNLIFTASLPFQAVYHHSEWIFGTVACKLVNSIYFLGFYSSVLFLTLMTFDRYLAVVHVVFATKQRRSCYSIVTAAIVWVVSVLASLESYFSHEVEDDPFLGRICFDNSDPKHKIMGTYSQFVLFFIFPLVVILYCYVRIGLRVISTRMKGKHRTVKLILVIVVLFFMCWSPYNVILLMKEQVTDPCDDSLDYPQYVTHNIAHLYFCVNPVFYTFLGRKFQNHVRRLLVKEVPCLKNHLAVSATSRSFS
ncbi:C-C chemokine receptor type 3 [Salminus brasiliensis]|uniref:C-C chemokine receptor type 3 n=1 Tax=Salminus brasiliensis TaxID=930266 RepID=UPI003B832457